MLKNEYLIAKFGLDTAENELIRKSEKGRGRMRADLAAADCKALSLRP